MDRITTRRNRRIARLALVAASFAALLSATEATAVAQAQNRVTYRPAYTYTVPAQPRTNYVQQPAQQVRYVQPAATQAPAYTYAQPAQAQGGDPYGFLAWLNGTRASYGLAPVGYDQNLANWAAMNNAQQNSRGIGHYVMGPARRQNSAMGNAASIGSMWMNSPAHRATLLDPTIRAIGLAGAGAYWTLNAY